MVKKYKLASEKTIKAGKGISTDKLSFEEALGFFKEQGKERNMNRFRYQGKVYDLSGKEISAPAAKKASSPKKAEKVYSGRGDGAKEVASRKQATMKYSGRGDGAKEVASRKESKSGAALIPAVGASAVARGRGPKAAGKPYNPNYTGKTVMAEGYQGKYGGEVSKSRGPKTAGRISSSASAATKNASSATTKAATAKKPQISAPPRALPPPETGFRGQTPEFMKKSFRGTKAGGVNPSKAAKRAAKGGRRSSLDKPEDLYGFLN